VLSAWGSLATSSGKELESNESAELHVFGLVRHTRPAAKPLDHAIMRNGLADELSTWTINFVRSMVVCKIDKPVDLLSHNRVIVIRTLRCGQTIDQMDV